MTKNCPVTRPRLELSLHWAEKPPTEEQWETNSCLPETDLFTCSCPGSRHYRSIKWYLWQYMTRQVGEYMPARLETGGCPVTLFGLFCPDSVNRDTTCSRLYMSAPAFSSVRRKPHEEIIRTTLYWYVARNIAYMYSTDWQENCSVSVKFADVCCALTE